MGKTTTEMARKCPGKMGKTGKGERGGGRYVGGNDDGGRGIIHQLLLSMFAFIKIPPPLPLQFVYMFVHICLPVFLSFSLVLIINFCYEISKNTHEVHR